MRYLQISCQVHMVERAMLSHHVSIDTLSFILLPSRFLPSSQELHAFHRCVHRPRSWENTFILEAKWSHCHPIPVSDHQSSHVCTFWESAAFLFSFIQFSMSASSFLACCSLRKTFWPSIPVLLSSASASAIRSVYISSMQSAWRR